MSEHDLWPETTQDKGAFPWVRDQGEWENGPFYLGYM